MSLPEPVEVNTHSSSAEGATATTPSGTSGASAESQYSPVSEREAISLYSSPLNTHTANKIRKFRRTLSAKFTLREASTGNLEENEYTSGTARQTLLNTSGEAIEVKDAKKSTFIQATMNGLNVLAGLGILSLPYAFLQSGWLVGLVLLVYLCIVTNYTGKLIGMCMSKDPRIRTYSDLGSYAYGKRGRWIITIVFCLELVTALSMFIALMADHLYAVVPSVSRNTWCVIGTAIVLPTCMTDRLSMLSNLSIIGVFTTVFLLFVLVEVGSTDSQIHVETARIYAVGSLTTTAIPYSIGLSMVGFAGHAVFPSIYDSLEKKKDYPKLINVVYVFSTTIYVSMGLIGYFFFADKTKEEITLNLYDVASNNFLVKASIWLVIINVSITSFAQTEMFHPNHSYFKADYQPLASIFETSLGLTSRSSIIMLRASLAVIPMVLAIVLPSFAVICAFVGAFCSFIVSGIFPILCYLKLFGSTFSRTWYVFNVILVIMNSVLCVLGTGAVFSPP